MRQPASAFGRRFLSTAVADAPLAKPAIKPASPNFSSGPCAKRPGYSLTGLADAPLGRSHRAKIGKSKLAGAITQTRELLEANGLPKDYHIGIVPASDTGAVEMAMWSLLGPKPVTVVHFESFGGEWYTDITKQLKLENVTNCQADYGVLPPLESVNWKTDDVVFTYNGTTAGVRCPPGWAPPADRAGLAICDATSAVFAMDMPWANLDVVTFSWQKCLGGEGAHGMLILSPRAVERIESYDPPWPLPKIFRMKKKGKLDAGIFEGATINTPSMLANEVRRSSSSTSVAPWSAGATSRRVVEPWAKPQSAATRLSSDRPARLARSAAPLVAAVGGPETSASAIAPPLSPSGSRGSSHGTMASATLA